MSLTLPTSSLVVANQSCQMSVMRSTSWRSVRTIRSSQEMCAWPHTFSGSSDPLAPSRGAAPVSVSVPGRVKARTASRVEAPVRRSTSPGRGPKPARHSSRSASPRESVPWAAVLGSGPLGTGAEATGGPAGACGAGVGVATAGRGAGEGAGAGAARTTGGAAADGTGRRGAGFGTGAALAAGTRSGFLQTLRLRPVRLSRTTRHLGAGLRATAFFLRLVRDTGNPVIDG
jgi:hypothetical protein